MRLRDIGYELLAEELLSGGYTNGSAVRSDVHDNDAFKFAKE